jgi:hypothetical protein
MVILLNFQGITNSRPSQFVRSDSIDNGSGDKDDSCDGGRPARSDYGTLQKLFYNAIIGRRRGMADIEQASPPINLAEAAD